MTVENLSDFFIVTVQSIDYRVYITNVDKKSAIYLLNNSILSDKGTIYFGGTYFRDIYSGANCKIYKDSWKEFKNLENIKKEYYCSDFYDVSLNQYGVKCDTSLRFWENKGWINKIDPYGWFQWYFRYWLGRRSEDDQRQINRWKRIVSRSKGILIKMIKNGKDSPKIRQILLH